MHVPDYVVSLYVATCGQNGQALGSDEKEIILLVYVILEASSGKIVGTKQILVRPDGTFIKDRSNSLGLTDGTSTQQQSHQQPLAITHGNADVHSSCNNNNNISSTVNLTVANNVMTNCNSLHNNNNSNTNNINSNNVSIPTSTDVAAGSIANLTTPPPPTTVTTIAVSNGPPSITPSAVVVPATQPLMDAVVELPIAIAHTAGKPLNEAIEEFDEYLRTLYALNDLVSKVDIKFITDGQLPLRQCLHREACVKDIALPSYYNKFCDLRKEFVKYKSGDLSRALVPVKDIKKILQMPMLPPPPQCIAEMMQELNLVSIEDSDFYVRESRDMITIIQTLLNAGHVFIPNEIVNLVLEPGICSIDDDIDGNCIVRARGLPWQSSDQDIAKFFRGLNVAKGGVALCLSPLGRRNGEALIRFISQEHRDMALKRHKHHIGNRYIEVYRATGDDFLAVAGGASNEAQAFLSKGAQVIIRMRGLPYDCTAKQVLDFFTTGENPCGVLDGNEGVLFVKKPDGRATGDAFVLFASESDAPKALARHRESIGQRYIELFRSTTAEVQQVLNRSLDPKTYESNHQPPLIAQLPAISLLPQHLITSGITKNCIRLRGLPYEALVEHILHFLDDFAKHIIYQGVHMVINAQGQPSGEAFIQMDSEDSARLCAQRKHNQFMVFGKKYRYIEVFQCSGDDMNMVLSGGLQTPVAAHSHHVTGKHASLLSPGTSMIGTSVPFGTFAHFTTTTPILATSHHSHHHHPHTHHHQHHRSHPHSAPSHTTTATAFYPHSFVYWPYPTPPVSPTTYFGQPPPSVSATGAHTPTQMAPQHHQAVYSLDFMTAVPPPLSPPTIAIPASPTQNAGGLILSPTKTSQTLTIISPKQFSTLPATQLQSTDAISSATSTSIVPTSSESPQQHLSLALTTKMGVTASYASKLTNSTQLKLPPQSMQNHHKNNNGLQGTAMTTTGTPVSATSDQMQLNIDTTITTTETTTTPPPPKVFNATTTSTPSIAVVSNTNAVQNIVSAQCVELYIS